MVRFFRVIYRLAGFFCLLGWAALEFAWQRLWAGRPLTHKERSVWMHRLCPRLLRLLRVRVDVCGRFPARGLVVSNHLSYLDVIVLGMGQPVVFVAKREVRSWPLLGWFAGLAGTLFIDRTRKSGAFELLPLMCEVAGGETVLGVFPEGTSTGGDRVLPFKGALLQPAVEHGWPVTPVRIAYALADGDAIEEICFWRDMLFAPHFLRLLSKDGIQATVSYGETVAAGSCRKELALRLHSMVCALPA